MKKFKCPNCGAPLNESPDGLHDCTQCEVHGDNERIKRIEAGLHVIDPLIEQDTKKLRERENLRRFIIRFAPPPSLVIKTENFEELEKKSMESPFKTRLGFLIGSMEVAAFLGWFTTNIHNFVNGKLHSIEFMVPFLILLQGIVFILLFRN
ncbi:MAG: hypothetical protein NWE91_02825 [Candidatus Bathyarchaeota archaeon]|nr:hypothetical protein [Candidatus Bathyarchaeota archaeon]